MRDKAVESACMVIGLMQGGQQEVRLVVLARWGFVLTYIIRSRPRLCDLFVWFLVAVHKDCWVI